MSKKTTFPMTQAMPKVADKADQDYEAASHMKTLLDAHEIASNPDHMKAVHALAGRHKKVLTSLKDLKDHYQTKFGQPAHSAPQSDDDGDERT